MDRRNGLCIMMEGLFNALGNDIIGMTTIVPLFLSLLGAGSGLIGIMNTGQNILLSLIPILSGFLVTRARSKRALSMLLNGIGRSAILLIPLGIVLGLSNRVELLLFFAVMLVHYLLSPITGTAWSYLLGVCVSDERRNRLIGRLYSVSGIITFLSGWVIKLVRASAISESMQYAIIFALGGTIMALSVVFYIPLKEPQQDQKTISHIDFGNYLSGLASCFKEKDFRRFLYSSMDTQIVANISAFFFLFAQNTLRLDAATISNLIIVQTIGLVVGGFAGGEVSSRFGVKFTIGAVRVLELIVPVCALLAAAGRLSATCAFAAVLIIGITKGTALSYQLYMLELVAPEKSMLYIIARSLAMLPCSLTSALIGVLADRLSFAPVFQIQLGLCLLNIALVAGMRKTTPRKSREGENEKDV